MKRKVSLAREEGLELGVAILQTDEELGAVALDELPRHHDQLLAWVGNVDFRSREGEVKRDHEPSTSEFRASQSLMNR